MRETGEYQSRIPYTGLEIENKAWTWKDGKERHGKTLYLDNDALIKD